jgi:uncharacterized protein YbjQ (UPF0145 family)
VSEGLPAVAAARMAGLRSSGTWGSALTAGEFAAIRSVGFEPVGQVFGAAVYSAGPASGYSCPAAPGSSGVGPAAQVSGRGGPGSFGPLVQTMDLARHTAVGRMITECAGLGGHGVVGVRLSRGSFPLGGPQFTALGTAVRAPGAAHGPPVPFTCEVSGQDFAKLIMTGWVPAGLVLGISIGSRHDDRPTARQARWGPRNAEVAGWTELVSQSRHDARRQLESDVRRLGADGVVIATMRMRVRERDCPAAAGRRDHIVEATLIGTAVARFSRAGQRRDGPALPIMPLGPQRSQAARIRI